MSSTRHPFKSGIFVIGLALLSAIVPDSGCARPNAALQAEHRAVRFGSCAGELTLPRNPPKLTPVTLELSLEAGCPAPPLPIQAAIEMREMPMHVAPVNLQPAGNAKGRYTAPVMFTMAGAWTVVIFTTNARTEPVLVNVR
jgi:hypothetical protein